MNGRTLAALGIFPLLLLDVPASFGQSDPLHPANPRTERVFAGGRPIAVETAPDGSTSGSPVVLSVSPSTGSGSSQIFTLEFSHPNAWYDLTNARIVVNDTLTGTDGCYVYVDIQGNIYLAQDDGWNWYGPVYAGTSSTLENSQCRVSALNSSYTGDGTILTMVLDLTFFAAFEGPKSVWGYTDDGTEDSGYPWIGSWTVP